MKYVYAFSEGNKDMRELLGGKGANLAEMTRIGLPVPRGFTVTTEACLKYYKDNEEISEDIKEEIFKELANLEKLTGKTMGDNKNPLLVSVRSGARSSMPGMMDTILNLGMNDEVVETLARLTDNKRFAYDCYRRFIQMFADVVMGFPKSSFEYLFEDIKKEKKVELDTDLTAEDLVEVVDRYKAEYKKHAGSEFPQDAKVQLINNDRAITYRRLNDIPGDWGTAVNVQEMVYGNMGNTSGTGVAFTRNPATGEAKLYGEYLINAQGEDVVAGIRTPQSIDTLKEVMPECYDEFVKICKTLEDHYKDMQDMEFTIENGKLFMLQTRSGKRTAEAALRIAVELVNEGKITKEEALLRVEPKQLEQLLHPAFDKALYFSADDVMKAHENGVEDIILAREETSPEDIEGMNIARGILTVRGGMTSHAAVVARGMGTCCVSGCGDLIVDVNKKTLTTKDGKVFKSTGNVYGEEIKTVPASISGNFETFMNWADEVADLEVRTNADNPRDAKVARDFGAKGIGLCRTEHMFFDMMRIFNFRKMIVAPTLEKREEALDAILPYQKDDFKELFKVMDGYEVTIRFLDPPLHEFLPHTDDEIKALAKDLDMDFVALKNKVESLKEFNPMMGHRGCRLAVTYPEIAVMQTKAVIYSALEVEKEGIKVTPEIMIPLVGDVNELKYVKNIVTTTADKILADNNSDLTYKVGTMIEIPRAALLADQIAEEAEFFSFGTNDLTQMTYGFSRDDASKFLKDYYDKKIFTNDPFASLDTIGVGKLVKMATELGRSTRSDIKLGICGEHGGDPKSIAFCQKVGLNYVSCSPFRVPVARLAAARAKLEN